MPRRRERRPPRSQTREEVLDAAARVIARRGLHGASVEAISEEAGFSTGAIYSNFEGKQALFLALYEERISRRARELRETIRGAGGPEAGLEPAAANAMELMDRERDWFLLYFEFALHAARDPAFGRRFSAIRDRGLTELATGIAEGLRHAGVDSTADPAVLARAIRALSYGLALDQLVDRGESKELLGDVLGWLFRGVRSDADTEESRADA